MYYSCKIDDNIECLPDIIPCEDLMKSNDYFDTLYATVFVPKFITISPTFDGISVTVRKEPKFGNWEHGFLHITHKDYNQTGINLNDRSPDYRRSERITWITKILENYNLQQCRNCGEIYYWEERYRGYVRPHLMVFDDAYDAAFLVVIEKRKNTYLLITSFYLENSWQIDKRLRKYGLIGQKVLMTNPRLKDNMSTYEARSKRQHHPIAE